MNDLNDLILNRLEIIQQLQSYIELNELGYKEKVKKIFFFFSKNIDTWVSLIEDADKEQKSGS